MKISNEYYNELLAENKLLRDQRDKLLENNKYLLGQVKEAVHKAKFISDAFLNTNKLLDTSLLDIELTDKRIKNLLTTVADLKRELSFAQSERDSYRRDMLIHKQDKHNLNVMLEDTKKELDALKHDVNLILNEIDKPKSVWKELGYSLKRIYRAI